ncbi:MAG: TonB-dependent receptor [Bacteroidales bacterium]|jgi:outer membrane receptor protein involved in Fe transport|nr:TonB-dependent receptor [Bacteroidales bacterium]MDD3151398.1 TonB-dependent receptor [Bacteroidales bacterium]MDD3913423.1 TonB-dependent receptor [Bacteroidales bacterium]MDD4633219.1 TonB-dependent receptor [Bacteroidales bacterium]
MKRLSLIIVLSILFSIRCFSIETGPCSIDGTVIDSRTKSSMEYVTVGIWQSGESTPYTGTITDQIGVFKIDNLPTGSYTLKITFVGYEAYETNFTLEANTLKKHFGKIELKENAQSIEGAEIVAIGSQMRFEIDKKVFDVDQNIANTGGSASEVLSNIPSVEVDNEGEISLRGSSNVTIWINGKASGLSAENRAQILEQLPAESIETIEIITNPSAKYSPEGTAGIINIVLKKDRKAGYYGSIQAGIDTQLGYNASGNINYNSGKFEAYANFGYRKRVREGSESTYRNNTDSLGNILSFYNQDATTTRSGQNLFGRAGITYHFTDKDQISLDAFGMKGGRTGETTNIYNTDATSAYDYSERLSTSTSNMLSGNLMLSYKHEFGKDNTLEASASYDTWNNEGNEFINQTSYLKEVNQYSTYQKQLSSIANTSWNFQADYVNKINENNKIEAGYKGTINREHSPVETYSGATAETAIFDSLIYNDFYYRRDIHALYGTYAGRINKFGYSLGLRGEYTGGDFKTLSYDENVDETEWTVSDYYSLFPSVFITYELPKNNEIQINYTRRISRPRGHNLNPFIDITDTLNISFGNPSLKPEFSDALELNYIKSWTDHTLSVSMYYRHTNNVIQRIRYRDGDVMKSTFENISENRDAGLEIVGKNSLFKFLDLTSTVNVYYSKLNGFTYYPEGLSTPVVGDEAEGLSWNARIIASLLLPHSMSLQITGGYRSPRIVAQGSTKSSYSLDAGFRKSFFNKTLNISINARDLLNSMKWETYTYGDGFTQEYAGKFNNRTIGLTVTWAFGNMKMSPKKRPAEVQTNDSDSDYEGE